MHRTDLFCTSTETKDLTSVFQSSTLFYVLSNLAMYFMFPKITFLSDLSQFPFLLQITLSSCLPAKISFFNLSDRTAFASGTLPNSAMAQSNSFLESLLTTQLTYQLQFAILPCRHDVHIIDNPKFLETVYYLLKRKLKFPKEVISPRWPSYWPAPVCVTIYTIHSNNKSPQ